MTTRVQRSLVAVDTPAPRRAADLPLPCDHDAERLLLQNMVGDYSAQAVAIVGERFRPEMFHRHDHKRLAAVILDLMERGFTPEWSYVRAEWKASGLSFDNPVDFEEFAVCVPRPNRGNLKLMVDELSALAERRRQIVLADRIAGKLRRGETVEYEDFRELIIPRSAVESVSEPMAAISADRGGRVAIVADLVTRGEITLLHGAPRAGKSLVALEIAASVASGTPAFGMLAVATAAPVLIVGNEDGSVVVRDRIRSLLRGRGVEEMPLSLRHAIHRGVSLDDQERRHQILREIDHHHVGLLVLDPLRSLTGAVDQGPSEFHEVGQFLRTVAERGIGLVLVHHDTKARAGVRETRRRAERASGGGLFSACDSPIHVEAPDASHTALHPDGFKHCPDPQAILLRREIASETLRLIPDANAPCADDLRDAQIIEFLKRQPGASGRQVIAAVNRQSEVVYRRLEGLRRTGAVTCIEIGKAKRWTAAPS